MEPSPPVTRSASRDKFTERDILFECPSCAKSLVVDESAEGMIVECPQCHISVIIPPKVQLADPGPSPHAAPSPGAAPSTVPPPAAADPSRPTPPPEAAPQRAAVTDPKSHEGPEIGVLRDRLGTLSSQLREVQTQWLEITNRIAARINDVNRELVIMGRLEISQKQILNEWTQVVRKIAEAASQAAAEPPPNPPPAPPRAMS